MEGGTTDNKNRSRNNRKRRFDFFSRDFHHSITYTLLPPLQSSNDSQIRAIESLSNIFWEFTHHNRRTFEDAISQIQILETVWRRRNIANPRVLRLRYGKLGDENRSWKNQKHRFDFFGHDFRHPTTHTLPLPFAIIAGPSNSQYCVFVKQFREFKILKNVWQRWNIVNSRVLRLQWEWGVMKIVVEKIENVGRALKKMFKVWMRELTWSSRQTPSQLAWLPYQFGQTTCNVDAPLGIQS